MLEIADMIGDGLEGVSAYLKMQTVVQLSRSTVGSPVWLDWSQYNLEEPDLLSSSAVS